MIDVSSDDGGAEIDEAIADYNAGRMGAIPATGTT